MREVRVDQYGIRYSDHFDANGKFVKVDYEGVWLGTFPTRELAELFGWYYAKEKRMVASL